MKILILNGPNLNLLGRRGPDVYGTTSLPEILAQVQKKARALGVKVEAFQSNEEGALIRRIRESPGRYDGIVFNPAGYTHTSVALRDALPAAGVPCVEVHLSNIYGREDSRHSRLTVGACVGQIAGFGGLSYVLGLEALVRHLSSGVSRKTKGRKNRGGYARGGI
jgi:3-dehydroquinate dehydratase-2